MCYNAKNEGENYCMILTLKLLLEFIKVMLCIFLICIILIIAISLLVGSAFGIIYKIFYAQIGPTCGFYALVYAVGKVKDINLKQEVRRIIIAH